MSLLRFSTTIPPRHAQRDVEAEYLFPERIVLDEASLAAFEAEMANPSEPNEALRALFRKK
jgi:hypothetical protein